MALPRGICIGSKIAPIFFNTMEDSGSLPIEMDCTNMAMGDVIEAGTCTRSHLSST
jgi:aconitase B